MARKKNQRPSPVGYSDGPHQPAESRKGGPFDDYEVRGALETLTRGDKIRKNSALMRAVKAEARRQLDAATATKKALGE